MVSLKNDTILHLGKNTKLSNKRMLLLEASKEKKWKLPVNYSNRVVSLNPGSQTLFSKIDVWKHIENARFATVKRLQVKYVFWKSVHPI